MDKLLYTVGVLAVIITGLIILINATTEPLGVITETEMPHTGDWKIVETLSATGPTCVDTPETESATEAITEPFETIAETELETTSSTTSSTEYFDVPLDHYMQDFIKAECKSKGIEPSIVIAMIERESCYDQYAIGDDGRALGLLQIHPKWHLQRMIRLKCTDLFQPYQNVVVGIDYLGELYNRYGDIGKALTAYNRGSYDGTITSYATAVMARANELERG